MSYEQFVNKSFVVCCKYKNFKRNKRLKFVGQTVGVQVKRCACCSVKIVATPTSIKTASEGIAPLLCDSCGDAVTDLSNPQFSYENAVLPQGGADEMRRLILAADAFDNSN